MFLGNQSSNSNTENANLFASYFKANSEPTAAWNDSQTINAITPLLNLGSLTVLEENIHRAVDPALSALFGVVRTSPSNNNNVSWSCRCLFCATFFKR